MSTAYWLQDYASEKPITLPRNALGLLLGVSGRCVSLAPTTN
jgi:hypothetical protein